jgi:hypothetical protein
MTVPMLALTALLVGCGGEEPPPAPTPEAKPAAPAPAPVAKIDLTELKKQAEQVTLVPAPKEMQKALDKANIKEALESLVQERKIAFDAKDADVAAVKTGVVLADTLLTVRTAAPEKLAERMKAVKSGMKAVKAGDDIDKTIDSLIGDIQNLGGGARDNLEQELEQMHAAVIPEIEYEAGDQIVPLIQAGAWLEGSNLLSAAIIKAGRPEVANDLLRQPAVCDYFLKYVDMAGKTKANEEVVAQLRSTLEKLKEISLKPNLTIEDVQEVKKQTDTVLGML